MMKIACVTLGSRGDIQPFIALAKNLCDHGHDAAVVTHEWAAPLMEFYDVRHLPVKDPGARYVRAGNGIRDFISQMQEGIRSMRESHRDILAACADFDLIIGNYGLIGIAEAELLNKPYITFAISGEVIPKKNPGFLSATTGLIPGLVLHWATRPYRKFRREIGLPEKSEGVNRLTLLAVSDYFIQHDDQWLKPIEIVGFQFLPPPPDYLPPVHVTDFINKDDKPILISLGSNKQDAGDFEILLAKIIKALEITKQRAVIQTNRTLTEVPANICLVESIPYSWLLPRVSMVVHHFGYGTTAEVLKAGLPSIPLPQAIDQFARSNEMYRNGLAHTPLNWKKTTSDEIADAIARVMQDEVLNHRIKSVSRKIQEESRNSKAVEVIEKYFA